MSILGFSGMLSFIYIFHVWAYSAEEAGTIPPTASGGPHPLRPEG